MKKFFLLLMFIPAFVIAQTQLTGVVVDKDGIPLPGVSVLIKGTQSGAVSNANGEFTLNVRPGQTLVLSFVGMQTQEAAYQGAPVRVTLLDDLKSLEEIVVIGYQTVRKADLTGAVSVFKPETMKNTVVTGTVADALATVPGLFVRSSGQPGAEGFVQIRGTSTFGSSTPLYVIDGIAVEGGANRDFNYNDIESIQVLKDASAAAIYGSRAANGVIIITTKKGAEGKMKIDISAKNTFQWLPRYSLAGKDQWIQLNDLAFKNAGRPLANHSDANTDWQNEVFKMGKVQDYNISFSGGAKSSNYFISANYQGNTGSTYGSQSDRLTFRANTSASRDFGENLKFTIGENLIISNFSVDELNTNPIIDVYRMLPTIPVYNENNRGGYGYGDGTKDVTFGTNPIAKENLLDTKNQNMRIRGNAFTEFSFFKSLKYRFNFGFESSSDSHTYLQKDGFWTFNQPLDPTTLNINKALFQSLVFDNTLEYNKQIGVHNVAAVAGTSYMTEDYTQLWGTKNDLLMMGDNYFRQLDGALNNPKTGSYQNLSKLYSLFGRVNYTYDNKYLFSATVRRDASSKFGPSYRDGVFPSVAAAWRISNEKFFNLSWVNDLKVRANYGVLGSSNIGYWDWVPFINVFPQVIFGTGQNIQTGMTQVKLVNTDLKWEELHQSNIGFDVSMLNNRFEINADFFIKTTKDVLTGMQILMTTGNNGGNPMVNAASLQNKGFEVALTWRDKIDEFNYSFNLNTSYIKNKILELGYDREFFTQWDTKSFVGSPIGEWYLIKTDGLFRTQDEVFNHVNSKGQLIQPNAKPGDVKFLDFNDDGMITDADRQHCGSSLPIWQMSLNSNFEYKGFDLMLQFNSAFGQKLFNGPRSAYDRFDDNSNYRSDYDAFDLDNNPTGKDPRPIYGDARNVRGDQDRWLENGNYLRLKQLAFGYTFPKSILGDNISAFRIFVNAQNILTLTSYRGLDPEFVNSNIWDRGYDPGSFPNPYGVTIGTQITF